MGYLLILVHVLLIYGSIVGILGAMVIACVPAWRITFGNLACFVVGGILGLSGAVNLGQGMIKYLPDAWRPHTRDVGNFVALVIGGIGAVLGGTLFVWIRMRLWPVASRLPRTENPR